MFIKFIKLWISPQVLPDWQWHWLDLLALSAQAAKQTTLVTFWLQNWLNLHEFQKREQKGQTVFRKISSLFCFIIQSYWSFSYLGLSVNSLNSVKRKILNNYRGFSKEFNFFLSEHRILCNLPMTKTTFTTKSNTSNVLYNFTFVEFSEFSEFSENIQIGKTQLFQ